MNGPAHYIEAERYATEAAGARARGDSLEAAALAAIGQVHALLANAAVAALSATGAEQRGWLDVAGPGLGDS
jgi:hypothetical protein